MIYTLALLFLLVGTTSADFIKCMSDADCPYEPTDFCAKEPGCPPNGNCGVCLTCPCRLRSECMLNAMEESFTCNCGVGYEGIYCKTNIDECDRGTDTCSSNAACTDTLGSYFCTCNSGYSGDGMTCTDIDECTTSADNCDNNAQCTNTMGSFTCACNAGYTGDGVTCTDINECDAGTDSCAPDSEAECINNGGSYDCACRDGYTGDGFTCTDDDECTDMTDNCDNNAVCGNTAGSFTCTCNEGWTGDGVTCTDINECLSNPCTGNLECINEEPGYLCC